MSDLSAIAARFLACLDRCKMQIYPYRHWLLNGILPEDTCAAIDALPVQPPAIGDTLGRRETNNSTRLFFGVPQRAAYPVCDALAEALQSDAVVRRLEALCGTVLAGSSLRIEYCLDRDGFWLEPHTDIGAKLYTMLIYLSDEPGSEAWGTDVLDGPDRYVASAPYFRGGGLIFIPGTDTWHGFRRRPIAGVRRSLIVNYVKPEWRSRNELAFPEQPVLAPCLSG
jgi:hypothetical protein